MSIDELFLLLTNWYNNYIIVASEKSIRKVELLEEKFFKLKKTKIRFIGPHDKAWKTSIQLVRQFLMINSFCSYGFGSSVLVISVEYVSYTSNYVDSSDKGTLHKIEVVARNYEEARSFFAKVVKVMRTQCDCSCGTSDLHINLCPFFKLTYYRYEEDFKENNPYDHSFVKFKEKFYKRVCGYRSSNEMLK